MPVGLVLGYEVLATGCERSGGRVVGRRKEL